MSFPVSITFDVKAPPTAAFDSLAQSATKLDQALMNSASNFDKFGQSVSKMEGPLGSVGGSMGQLEGSMSGLEGSLGGAAGSMGEFAGATEQLNGSIGETGGFIAEASGSMSELSGSTSETGGAMTELSGTTSEFNGSISETGGFVTETGTAMGELGTATDTTGVSLETLNTGVETTNTALTDTQSVAAETGTAMTDFGTATDTTNESLVTSNDALGQIIPSLADTQSGAEGSAQGFETLAPAVEGTNTALDSSSGLLEGVAPLLGTTGENAAAAETPMTDLGGAIGVVNEELPGVNGGLTEGNTLMGDFGENAGTAEQKTTDLQGSMASLSFALVTVVGAGVGVVGSFLAIRDAGFKVEAANLRAEKATSALDKAMLSVSKAITKLATDSEAPIAGMGRLQTAFANFQKLVDAGVISGPKYAAALAELKAAGDALEGSTVKDKNAIEALNISLDGLGQKASKADLENRKLTKSLEAQSKAWLDAGLNIATLVGGLGSMIQTLTSAGTAAVIVKGAFVDLAIIASQSLIPALAAIALPVGIAVAAIVGFVAAVTAIRANLRVFDDMGIAIGKVFPALIPMLDGARQAFINFSDAINTSVAFILQGFDQLTGGSLKLSQHWAEFTDTLPQGTANVNVLTTGLAGLSMAFMDSSKKATLSAGQFKVVGDSIVRLSDGAKIGSGSWTMLDATTVQYVKSAAKVPPAAEAGAAALDASTTAADAYGASAGALVTVNETAASGFSELSNAQKLSVAASNQMVESLSKEAEERYNSFLVAQKYLMIIEGITPAAGLSMAAITGMGQAHMEETQKTWESVSAAAAYIETHDAQYLTVKRTDQEILNHAKVLQDADKATGKATESTAKHIEELNKLGKAHTDAAAEIAYYADATNMANRMELEFQAGIDKANLGLNNQQFALAENAGELTRQFEQLSEGTLLEVSYSEGVYAAAKALKEKITSLAKAIGEYQTNNALIKEGGILLIDLISGYVEAKSAIDKHTQALATQAGALAAWNDEQTRTKALANAVIQGYLDQQQALQDLATEAGNAIGQIAALRAELANSASAGVRFAAGLIEGKRSALEYLTGIEQAKGETIGFRQEVMKAAADVGGSMQDMASQSTEQIQRFIEVVHGVPEAFNEVIGVLGGFTQKVAQALGKAGEEGADAFMANVEQMEKDLGATFSEPLKQDLQIAVQVEKAKADVETALGVLGAALSAQPLTPEMDTSRIDEGISLIEGIIGRLPAVAQTGFAPLQGALDKLRAWDPGTGITTLAPILAEVASGAENMGVPMQNLLTAFGQIPNIANASVAELETLKASFAAVGLTLNTASGEVTNAAGVIVGSLGTIGPAATAGAGETVAALDTLGPAGTAARTTLAYELVALEFLMNSMAQEVKQSAIEVSTAFANMAANTNTSMQTMASGFLILIAAFTKVGSASQQMATTVSGSFSNMASNTTSSLNKMASGIMIILASFTKLGSEATRMSSTVGSAFTSMSSRVTSATNTARTAITTLQNAITTLASQGSSKASSLASAFSSAMSRVSSSANSAASSVRSLQSAINSLQSKSITITTTYVTRYQTMYVAKGGAYVSTSPTTLGPLKISEFGQKELVSVLPLESPSGQPITGPAQNVDVAASGPGARAYARSGEQVVKIGEWPEMEPAPNGEQAPMTDAEINKKATDFINSVFESIQAKAPKKGQQTIIRELPIVIKIDARTLIDIINRRIFEMSDALI